MTNTWPNQLITQTAMHTCAGWGECPIRTSDRFKGVVGEEDQVKQ